MADASERGRMARGLANGKGRLTDDDVGRIRSRVAAGEHRGAVADHFGVTQAYVNDIVARRARR
jgi:hypothetical protein